MAWGDALASARRDHKVTVDDLNNWACSCGSGPKRPNGGARLVPATRAQAKAGALRHVEAWARLRQRAAER